MNYLNHSLLMFFVFLFISCDCTNVDCVPPKEYFIFNIVDAADSTDLFFGDDPLYRPEDIDVYSAAGDIITFHDLVVLENPADSNPSLGLPCKDVMEVSFSLSYGIWDVDALELSFDIIDTECCGEYQRLNSVYYNGVEVSLPVREFDPVILAR